MLGAVAGGAAVADDERPRVVVAVRMRGAAGGQREQEQQGGEEQAEGSHGPDHSTRCAKTRCEVTGRSQAERDDPAACAACSTPSSSPFSSAASARSSCSAPARSSPSAASPTRPATPAPRSTAASRRTSSSSSATAWATRRSPPLATTSTARPAHLNLDRLPFTGFQTTWSVKPAAGPPYKPDYDPDSASTGTMWATGTEDDRRADLAGPEQRDRRAGQEPADGARARAEAGQEGRQRVDRGDHRRDAGGARLAHLAARLPGPGRHRRPVQDGDEGGRRPRLDRRADRRPPASTSCSAAGATASPQTITGGPDAGKTVEQSAARQGYTEVNDAAGLDAARRSDRPLLGLFAPVNMTTEWNGPVATRGDGTPAQRCETDQPPGERAEPARDDEEGDRPARGRPRRLLPPGRGRVDRQAGPRGQRVRADRRDGRVRQRDQGRAGLRARRTRTR